MANQLMTLYLLCLWCLAVKAAWIPVTGTVNVSSAFPRRNNNVAYGYLPNNLVIDKKKGTGSIVRSQSLSGIASKAPEMRSALMNSVLSPDAPERITALMNSVLWPDPSLCFYNYFPCANRLLCIHPRWVCDHDNDCKDNSDELGCITTDTSHRPTTNAAVPRPDLSYCPNNEFVCADKLQCIPPRWVCDHENDCADNSDELGCRTNNNKWDNLKITYTVLTYASKLPKYVVDRTLEKAAKKWSQASAATLARIFEGTADINIRFVTGSYANAYNMDGKGGIISISEYPPDGRIYLDDDENWIEDIGYNDGESTSLYQHALRSFGIALGLPEADTIDSILYPTIYYYPQRELDQFAIDSIQTVYGAPQVTAFPPTTTPLRIYKWDKLTITYNVITYASSFPKDAVDRVLENAAKKWSHPSAVKLTRIFTGTADIKIEFVTGSYGTDYNFDGKGGINSLTFHPPDGRIYFDDDENWVEDIGYDNGESKSLYQMALYSFGIALGLSNVDSVDSIMHLPVYYRSQRELDQIAIDGIQSIYGVSRFTSPTNTSPLLCNNLDGNDGQCELWKFRGECERNPAFMSSKCWKTCSRCDGPQECANYHSNYTNCENWAARGECRNNTEWMMSYCFKACMGCQATGINRWDRLFRTYNVVSYTSKLPKYAVDRTLENAAKKWSHASALTLARIYDGPADIKIHFAAGRLDNGYNLDGKGGVFASISKSPERSIYFDEDENWVEDLGYYDGDAVSLYQVALNSFGFILGLSYVDSIESIMHRAVYFRRHRELDQIAIDNIQAIYGARQISTFPLTTTFRPPLSTTTRPTTTSILATPACNPNTFTQFANTRATSTAGREYVSDYAPFAGWCEYYCLLKQNSACEAYDYKENSGDYDVCTIYVTAKETVTTQSYSGYTHYKRQLCIKSYCSNNEFLCADRLRCVLQSRVCDRNNDCVDHSDERGCTTTSSTTTTTTTTRAVPTTPCKDSFQRHDRSRSSTSVRISGVESHADCSLQCLRRTFQQCSGFDFQFDTVRLQGVCFIDNINPTALMSNQAKFTHFSRVSCTNSHECRKLTNIDAPKDGYLLCVEVADQTQYCDLLCNNRFAQIDTTLFDYVFCGPSTNYAWSFERDNPGYALPRCVVVGQPAVLGLAKTTCTSSPTQQAIDSFVRILLQKGACSPASCVVVRSSIVCGETTESSIPQ